jgi:hypothetical protein
MRRWTVNPPMGQVIGGWIGAMVVLGIAGGWLFGPTQVTLHTVPPGPRSVTQKTGGEASHPENAGEANHPRDAGGTGTTGNAGDAMTSTVAGTIGAGEIGTSR